MEYNKEWPSPRNAYSELWFGLEVGLYILLPLLIITVFGTVNYCKVGKDFFTVHLLVLQSE
jgi:hypothetical protein